MRLDPLGDLRVEGEDLRLVGQGWEMRGVRACGPGNGGAGGRRRECGAGGRVPAPGWFAFMRENGNNARAREPKGVPMSPRGSSFRRAAGTCPVGVTPPLHHSSGLRAPLSWHHESLRVQADPLGSPSNCSSWSAKGQPDGLSRFRICGFGRNRTTKANFSKGFPMNIQEFIRDAIVQIVSGVAEAREGVEAHGARAGSDPVYGHLKDNKVMTDSDGRQVTLVEFDVALTKADGTGTKGGIGVFLGGVGVGSQAAIHGEASSHSRIRFSVPVVLPGSKKDRR